ASWFAWAWFNPSWARVRAGSGLADESGVDVLAERGVLVGGAQAELRGPPERLARQAPGLGAGDLDHRLARGARGGVDVRLEPLGHPLREHLLDLERVGHPGGLDEAAGAGLVAAAAEHG